jgi:hypothetical protein
VRPIQSTGWAFPLSTRIHFTAVTMKWCISRLSVLLLVLFLWFSNLAAQASSEHHQVFLATGITQGSHGEYDGGGWEESAQGVTYSEFNHRFAGFFVLLFGLAELGHALRYPLASWIRLVLPSALSVIRAYLLVWSGHEA